MQQLMVASLEALQAPDARDTLDPILREAVAAIIGQESDPAVRADMLRLPSESSLTELASHRGGADPHAICGAREGLRRMLGQALANEWRYLFEAIRVIDPYAPEGEQIGRRALANVALDYLSTTGAEALDLVEAHYRTADNLTDRLVALRALQREDDGTRAAALLEDFYERFGDEALAVNHWLQLQAENPRDDAVERVKALMEHPAYDSRNPNKIRAVVGGFSNLNASNFHRKDGAGYALLGSVIEELNERNPQIASRLLTPLTRWRNFPSCGDAMRAELSRLAALPNLSRDVFEVVSKSLVD